jgi:hypothetical protein
VPATPELVEGSKSVIVSVKVTGLTPGIRYTYKITATNAEGTVSGRGLVFRTAYGK